MNTKTLCSGCGLPLPPDAPAGLCPQCLLKSDAPTISGGEPLTPVGAAPARPIPGQPFGQYQIVRLLGKGGMGEVYEAEHLETKRRVALKVMSHALASEQDRKRFLREGRLAASVNHPNVVYIYGSEEIAGVPVIAMELVSDGTLKDLLKRKGPLPVGEAVEAILQMIAGLEAAQNAGVLHRDIKPANCFVAADATVKVGDFGLSVSTLARGESLLTASGAVLGTPAYASPEQLRGEELDVRSDVYSVGATMYHILTGRTPFAAVDFVKLITEVLDKEPEAPSALRQEIPKELSRAILRCLAKDCKARFQTYEELKNALLPFAGRQAEAAPPARRFFASLIDELIAYGPSLVFLVYWSFDPLDKLARERTLSATLTWLPFYFWYLIYYSISEGFWGAAIGKQLLGLRVVNLAGHQAGLLKGFLRTAVFMVPFTLPTFVLMAVMPLEKMQAALANQGVLVTDWLWLVLLILLFVTMRRRNGYAAIHDLVSKTRVIVRLRSQSRPAFLNAGIGSQPPALALAGGSSGALLFGPYIAKDTIWNRNGEYLLNGFDPILRRNVWIHTVEGTEATASIERPEISRPGRLRWLAGGVKEKSRWNVYEASEGAPFLLMTPQPWSILRYWLLDLADEFAAGVQEPTTAAPVAMDRLWVTRQNRILLLDFPCPTVPASKEAPAEIHNTEDLQVFLAQVSARALISTDHSCAMDSPNLFDTPAVPSHARGFLKALSRHAFEKPEFILGNLSSLVMKPAELTRGRRAASLAFFPALILIFGMLLGLMINFETLRTERTWANQFPNTPSFPAAAQLYITYQERLKDGENATEDVELARTYLAKHFSFLGTNQNFWTHLSTENSFNSTQRELLRAAISSPVPNPEQLEAAEKVIPNRLEEKLAERRSVFFWVMAGWCVVCSFLFGLVELFGSLLTKSSPVLSLFSITVVGHSGEPVTRGRLLGRWSLVWLPSMVITIFGLGAVILAFVTYGGIGDFAGSPGWATSLLRTSATAICISAAIIWILGLGYAVLFPQRSLADRVVGTWLVMK